MKLIQGYADEEEYEIQKGDIMKIILISRRWTGMAG